MNRTDDVRPSDVENLVATFMVLEIFERWICGLQHCSHSAVGDDDAVAPFATRLEGGYQRGDP